MDVLVNIRYQLKLLVNAFVLESQRIVRTSFLMDSAKLYLKYSSKHPYLHSKNAVVF